MFPVCLEATEMDCGKEHKGKWHSLAICISLVAAIDPRGHAGEAGHSGIQTTVGELSGKGEGRTAKVGEIEGRCLGGLNCTTGCECARLRSGLAGGEGMGGGRGIWREGDNPRPPSRGIACALGTRWKGLFLLGKPAGWRGPRMRRLPSRGGRGVRGEKGRGGRSCCAGSSRRGRGCGVTGAEDRRHWSLREGKGPAPDRTGRGRVEPGTPPPPSPRS